MKSIATLLLAIQIALFSPLGFANEDEIVTMDEEINRADQIFDEEKIGKDFSPSGYAELARVIKAEIEYYKSLPKDENPRKKVEPFLDYAEQILEQAQTDKEKYAAFYVLKRVLYSSWTLNISRTLENYPYAIDRDPVVDERGVNWGRGLLNGLSSLLKPVLGDGAAKRIKQLKRMWIPSLNVQIPLPKNDLDQPIGAEQAAKEAKFLADPANSDAEIDLAKMTVAEIADLDISNSHPAWYSQRALDAMDAAMTPEMAAMNKFTARWKYVEDWAEKRISKKLSKKMEKEVSYKIATARRVMFLDSIYASATSPKAGAEDAYGEDWKIKWGDEVQTEVIANRLWIGLGGKYTDLVYANGPGAEGTTWQKNDGLVLVLRKENAEKRAKVEAKGECYAVTVDEFKTCLRDAYSWNADAAVLDHGVLTEANFEAKVGKYLPKDVATLAEYKEKYVGAVWVTFRESMLEFKSKKAVKRGGAAAYSSVAANEDRLARGGVIFNMWIGNRDAKDDNNKGYILSDFPGRGMTSAKTGNLYVEAQHDMGYSFGRALTAGEINELAGEDFIKPCLAGALGKLCFKEAMAYLPEAWKNATYSDALWMAKKVAAISADDLREILSYTNWPEFMHVAFVNKMGTRQRALAEAFGIEAAIPASSFVRSYTVNIANGAASSLEGANIAVPLTTFAQQLGISGKLSNYLAGTTDVFEAELIVDGELNDCWESNIMDFLQKELYPSGLTQRMSRFNDNQEEVGCAAERASFKDVLSGE